MRAWRLVAARHAPVAFDGTGAARFGGRWNPPGLPMVYLADSLALATLEMSVHLTGGRIAYRAIQVDIAERDIVDLDPADLKRRWRDDTEHTRRIGEAWLRRADSFALRVPSALVDPASGERNLLLSPRHRRASAIREVQQLAVTLDERLGSP
jgi:RES domain-containing protein